MSSQTESIDLRKDAMALQRLREAAEKAKIKCLLLQKPKSICRYVTATASGPKHLVRTLTLAKLNIS